MNGSLDREDALFEEAKRLFDARDLAKAYELFRQIFLARSRHWKDAERYLSDIARISPPTRDLHRGRPSHGTPMSPPFGIHYKDRDNPIEGAATGTDSNPMPTADPDPIRPPYDGPYGHLSNGRKSAEVTVSNAPLALHRTPHMNLDPIPPVEAEDRLLVRVYTDTQTFREGESGETILIEAPPEQTQFEVDVWLTVGEPFKVEGAVQKRLVIRRDVERSRPVEFLVLRPYGLIPAAESALFSALFSYQGRPCGRVSRKVFISALQAEKPAEESLANPEIRIDAKAERPDLSVRIVRNGDGEHLYDCLIETPLLSAYRDGATEAWRLPSASGEFVKNTMAQFTSSTVTSYSRMLALKGAGIEFFEASPSLFRKVFWELIDRKLPLRSISIVTEEPFIPWELMVPTRHDEEREPLGVSYLMSRWTSRDHILPPQRLPLLDAFVVAPRDSKLKNAEEEVSLILKEFPSLRIDPVGLETLNGSMSKGGKNLLHFICHGKSGNAGGQILLLEKQEQLASNQLRAMSGVKKAIREHKPLVFLNACEVGRQEPALVGAGGFAEAFMALGASGVIAPLWSVKDSVAHEIAAIFYDRIKKEPDIPFTQILADLRERSYAEEGGEDTYAAYCFYGDPLAHRAAS